MHTPHEEAPTMMNVTTLRLRAENLMNTIEWVNRVDGVSRKSQESRQIITHTHANEDECSRDDGNCKLQQDCVNNK